MNRKRTSPEDIALFRDALKDTKPLKRRRAPEAAPAHAVRAEPPKPVRAVRAPLPPVRDEDTAPAIGGHRESHLRRGRLEPEARIDLHGMRQEQAWRALARFFARAHAEDKRLVLVITGKTGVLRTMLPRWLADADLKVFVSGIAPAHARHGGAGAFYVSVKRKRP